MPSKELTVASVFSVEGERFSLSLKDDCTKHFESIDASYYAIASSISLTWTKHAIYDEEFINYAAEFIDSKIPKDPTIPVQFAQRFGPDSLDLALTNYRIFYNKVKSLMPDFYTCDALRIHKLQVQLLSKLNELRISGVVTGLGPWLFTGPFKIILTDQSRFWEQDSIDAITLPTGMEVDKAMKMLYERGYSFMNGFDPHWLEKSQSSLLDNYATYQMMHSYIVKIGEITNTPAIHINSALYQYGRGDISI